MVSSRVKASGTVTGLPGLEVHTRLNTTDTCFIPFCFSTTPLRGKSADLERGESKLRANNHLESNLSASTPDILGWPDPHLGSVDHWVEKKTLLIKDSIFNSSIFCPTSYNSESCQHPLRRRYEYCSLLIQFLRQSHWVHVNFYRCSNAQWHLFKARIVICFI